MATIWGINYSAVKYAGLAFGPLTFTLLRILVTVATLGAIALAQRNARPTRSEVIAVIGLGMLGNGIYQILFVEGVSRTRVASAALIVAAAPALVALVSRLRGVERIRTRGYIGIALSIIGVAIVVIGSPTGTATHASAAGKWLMIAAVCVWAVFTVGIEPYTHRVDPIQLNALSMAGGLIPLAFTLPLVARESATSHPGATAWLALVYASVLSLALGYILWLRGLRVLGSTRTAMYGNLQPIVAALTGWALLGEVPTPPQIAGTVVIISGIVLTRI